MKKKSSLNRPYLRIFFDCCQVYQRVYRNPSGEAYAGCCPRCLRMIRFDIAPHGTSSRSFTVR